MKTKEVHINTLRVGDTVIHEGKAITLTKSNLTRCDFLGARVCGDSYCLGYKPVQLVTDFNDNNKG